MSATPDFLNCQSTNFSINPRIIESCIEQTKFNYNYLAFIVMKWIIINILLIYLKSHKNNAIFDKATN